VEELIVKARETLKGEDTDAMKTATDALNTKIQEISTEMYKNAAASAGAAGGAGSGAGPEASAEEAKSKEKSEDVIDADFEVVDKDKK